jgi:hypothetical protein
MKIVHSLSRLILPAVAALAFALPAYGEMLAGGTVKFPPDKPVFTIETPADWKVEYMGGAQAMDLEAPDSSVMMSISALAVPGLSDPGIIADAATVKDAETAKAFLLKRSAQLGEKGAKPSDPTELMVAGQKAFQTKIKSEYGGDNQYVIFSPDGKTYYWISVLKGDATKIIESIKAAS